VSYNALPSRWLERQLRSFAAEGVEYDDLLEAVVMRDALLIGSAELVSTRIPCVGIDCEEDQKAWVRPRGENRLRNSADGEVASRASAPL
jgi:hypothetical protein